MPEAEDVLLHAAERVHHALRARWIPRADAERGGELTLARESRRLGLWLASAFGGDAFALAPCDPPPRASWLARLFGDRARWQDLLESVPFCDGAQIFLPRALTARDGRDPRLRLLLMALGQARRAARGSLAALPAEPRARDCAYALEGRLPTPFWRGSGPGWHARSTPSVRGRSAAGPPAVCCVPRSAESRRWCADC